MPYCLFYYRDKLLIVTLTCEFDQGVEYYHRVTRKTVTAWTHVPQGLADKRWQGPIVFTQRPKNVYHFWNTIVIFERFSVVLVRSHINQYAATYDQ